jgi:hypothetical protein
MSSKLMGHVQPSSHAPCSQSRRRSPAARYVTEPWSSPPILLLGLGSEGLYSVLKRVEEGALERTGEAWEARREAKCDTVGVGVASAIGPARTLW